VCSLRTLVFDPPTAALRVASRRPFPRDPNFCPSTWRTWHSLSFLLMQASQWTIAQHDKHHISPMSVMISGPCRNPQQLFVTDADLLYYYSALLKNLSTMHILRPRHLAREKQFESEPCSLVQNPRWPKLLHYPFLLGRTQYLLPTSNLALNQISAERKIVTS
jgi:hypothetical protein